MYCPPTPVELADLSDQRSVDFVDKPDSDMLTMGYGGFAHNICSFYGKCNGQKIKLLFLRDMPLHFAQRRKLTSTT